MGDDLIVLDVEMLKHGLVELASAECVAGEIVVVRAGEKVQASLQRLSDDVFIVLVFAGLVLGGSPSLCEPRLLALELVDVYGVGVVGVEHLLALSLDLIECVLKGLLRGSARRQDVADVGENGAANLLDLGRRQGHGGPGVLDEAFELPGLDGAEGAAVLERIAPETDEVVVDSPGTIA